ncbi:TSL-kinase interacting protein 1-like isoform X1 [Tripterygium wilfordii]|uniref:TSL-kinase interacting protein 1-like isoform X1 n=1 Tax=Tripterygium wilfordii TaxID=458696 RepID=A0A7J7CTT0_TRIWF|nr:TSL-kinase interacting protein 1-like [Tripterygium wilfordii]XP_038721816.1 TSL-kinase interacting protein 1-like [Tripterygium wilfordii]KAF5737535.1 TSL-kinase interacting protein 1-like isoform X1 [Tripterygium wilfordii]
MLIESEVSLASEVQPQQDNISMVPDGDPGVTQSATNNVAPQQQPPAKKPTRQWAAWTHQEEESFFTALRQVGKNFEKITCRVQSKNKDQVRHYYYRLVRRMNKLLGPGLCLDAKNSKDTNAAMLRWWSLLEKYNCKASKLHLKPRRFKIFIEALEHQLLKDQKKNVRKRRPLEENCSSIASTAVTSQSRTSAQDSRTCKLVLVDSQNIEKLGPGKGLVKRNANSGGNRCGNKGDTTATKPNSQRRKQGRVVSSAAYKKWEKAAIAGVSLVADAAEHLERTVTDKEVEDVQCMPDATENLRLYVSEHLERTRMDKEVEHEQCMPVENGLDPPGEVPYMVTVSQNPLVEGNSLNSMKLKLQLFPIDDGVRRALEMDKHNPHLELTLSTRKKISSVLEHMNRKWGNSSAASGDVMLFPYSAQRENLVDCQRWTQDSTVSAADVYAMIGSPPVFRLRYGWFSKSQLGSATPKPLLGTWCIPCRHHIDVENVEGQTEDSVPTAGPSNNDQSEKLVDPFRDQRVTKNDNHDCTLPSTDDVHVMHRYLNTGSRKNLVVSFDSSANISLHRKDIGDRTNPRQLEDAYDLALNNGMGQSAGEWADSLTNISVGDLLSELPQDMDTECIEPPAGQCFQQIPFSCDSFDAAIAAHMSRYQNKTGFASMAASHASSIWDAEQTCDAFSFQKNHVLCQDLPKTTDLSSSGLCKQVKTTSSAASGDLVEELSEAEQPMDCPCDPMEECTHDAHDVYNPAKDFTGLTDIYWPESLGPLDLDIPPSKYHNEDLILSDSLGGLNRLIASSLDTVQNCSFFGLDKKEPPSTVETHETASFINFKVDSGA